MELPVYVQLREALLALAVGVSAGLFYDILRIVRRRIKLKLVTLLCDTLFWIFCTLTLFSLGLSAGGGKQRLFALICAFLGGTVYFVTVSRFITRFLSIIADGIAFLLFWLSRPISFAWKFFRKSVVFAKKAFSSRLKWYKIKMLQKKSPRAGRRAGVPGGYPLEVQTIRYTYEAYPRCDPYIRDRVSGDTQRQNRGGER